jgi:DNA-binding response OmpR family regulator
MIAIISASDKQVSAVADQLKARNFSISTFDNLFEFKKKVEKEVPELILVADNLREKNTVDLMNAIQGVNTVRDVPIVGIAIDADRQNLIAFMQNGAVDAVAAPFNMEEIVIRIHLRIQESQLRQHFTANTFFWNEAQEKEQGKRTGVFKFYDDQNTEVGNISVKGGRLVHATYGSLIKDDAFLQLACNDNLKFVFEDLEDVPGTTLNEGITNLLMEAAKLKDEIKKQEGERPEEVKILVIDENRIARIMASRIVKKMGYECKVTGPKEMTVRFMANYAPQLIILDQQDAPELMGKLWPTPRTDADIPVIIYCDEDVKDINFDSINSHKISGTVYKSKFHEEFASILQGLKIV